MIRLCLSRMEGEGPPPALKKKLPCCGEDHMAGNDGYHLRAEDGLGPTVSKKVRLSVLQPQGTKFLQH